MTHLPVIAAPEGVVDRIRAVLPDALLAVSTHAGEVTLHVERTALLAVLQQLRDLPDCQFVQLMDIAGVDFPERAERFEVNYHLLSLRHNRRVRVRVTTDDRLPIPSAVPLWPVAGWLEREVWDMYGVLFEGNPDHRRILTDYGFEGHPFRKDFPLTGHVELHYSEEAGRVVYAPVRLKQDFRNFDFLSPWEGSWPLPGDEKSTNLPGDEKSTNLPGDEKSTNLPGDEKAQGTLP